MDAVGEDERVAIKVLNVRKLAVPTFPLMRKKTVRYQICIKSSICSHRAAIEPEGGGGGGGTLVNVCGVCAAGISEPLPHYSLFFGQL